MPLDSIDALVGALCASQLLTADQSTELARDLRTGFADPKDLARELVRRGWLTRYQAEQLLRGRAGELVLGQYVLLERLSEGGMGQVFRVRHRRLDRIQALKLIRPHLLDSPDAVRRFQREARAAARLAHPNIVMVFDADEVGGKHLLVMEYVEGPDLGRFVQRHGPLPAGRACDYVRQAALGLQHAHEARLVHRDIKPSNLLLAAGGSVVKVADLGLVAARTSAGPDPSSGGLTVEGVLMGTPDYMAPEQAADARAADGRADIYSLGCTLYFLLSGRPPFPGGSLAQKLVRHEQADPPGLEAERPELPPGLGVVLRRMLAKRPEDRFQRAADVAAALAPFSQPAGSSESPTVPPPARAEGSGATHAKVGGIALQTTLSASPPTAPGTALAGTTVGVAPPQVAPAGGARPPGRRFGLRRRRWLLMGTGGVLLAAALVLTGVLVWGHRRPNGAGPPVAGNSPLDALDPVAIRPAERFAWQPDGLVAVLGEHRWRQWAEVYAVAVSPDGRLVASAGDDQVVRLWDVPGGEAGCVLRGHTNRVRALAFSPDGGTLASAGDDLVVRLWDVATHRPRAELPGHTDSVRALAFAPDGGTLASAGDDGTVRLWDTAAGKAKQTLPGHPGGVRALAFPPGGDRLVSAGADGAVKVWDVATGAVRADRPAPGGRLVSLAVAPGGGTVAAGDEEGTVRVWEVAGKEAPRSVRRHDGLVLGVAFSRDGRTLVSAGYDELVKLWDVAGLAERATLQGHRGRVETVAFSADGRTVVSAGEDRVIRRWDVARGTEQGDLKGHTAPVRVVAFSPDGRLLASGGEDAVVRLWDVAARLEAASLSGHREVVAALAFAPDGKALASGSRDETVKFWDVATGKERSQLGEQLGEIHSLAISPDGRSLAVGVKGPDVRVWDLAARKVQRTLPGHTEAAWGLAFSPDGATLATGDGDWEREGKVRLWGWATDGPPRVLNGHKERVRAVAYAPDGKTLASAGNDGKVRLWDVAAGRLRAVGLGHEVSVESVVYAPDGGVLASADDAGRVILWDPASGEKRRSWDLPGAVHSLGFAPDSRHLATGNTNGTVYVLRLAPPRGQPAPAASP